MTVSPWLFYPLCVLAFPATFALVRWGIVSAINWFRRNEDY